MLGEQGVETQGLHLHQSLVRLVQSGSVGGVCGPGGEAFHDPVAARRHLPVPCGHGDPGIPLSGECPGSVATLFGHECPCVGRGAKRVARKELGLGTLSPQCHGLWCRDESQGTEPRGIVTGPEERPAPQVEHPLPGGWERRIGEVELGPQWARQAVVVLGEDPAHQEHRRRLGARLLP